MIYFNDVLFEDVSI